MIDLGRIIGFDWDSGNTRKSEDAMPKKLKPIPAFASEADERAFWETHDTTDYFDLSKAVNAQFPNLKPSTTAVSLELPTSLFEQIKVAANKRDVPSITYQNVAG